MVKRVTIKDVAQRAGVSVASVSYAINGVNKVNDETRKRVLRTVEELGFRPSMTARSLSDGASKLIGVTLPITEAGDIPGTLFENNPFFSEFLSGIELVTRGEGYDILISGLAAGETYKDWIYGRGLDGLIMLGVYPRDLFEEIRSINIPVVLADTYETYSIDFHRVMVDDELGGYIAAKHLIDLGHRSIAIAIGSVAHSEVNSRRYTGFRRAVNEAGDFADPPIMLEGGMSYEGGERVGERILGMRHRPTAVFAGADVMALGIIRALNRAGLDVPWDMSVVGFDDIKFSAYASPGLTTVRQDTLLKGKTAARLILDDLKRGERTSSFVTIPIELIIRETTRNVAGRNICDNA